MNNDSEPLDDIDECYCGACKSIFWVPYYAELPELGHPSFCAFCGLAFDFMVSEDEEGN